MDLLAAYRHNLQLGLIEGRAQSSCYDQEELRSRISKAYRTCFGPVETASVESCKLKSKSGDIVFESHETPNIELIDRLQSSLKKMEDVARLHEMELQQLRPVVKERDALLEQVESLKGVIASQTEPSRVLERVSGNSSEMKLEIYRKQISALTRELAIVTAELDRLKLSM